MNIPLNPMFYGHTEVGTPGSFHVQQHMHLEAPVTGFHHEDLAAVAWETRPEDSEKVDLLWMLVGGFNNPSEK